jgi:hypothetical protein
MIEPVLKFISEKNGYKSRSHERDFSRQKKERIEDQQFNIAFGQHNIDEIFDNKRRRNEG